MCAFFLSLSIGRQLSHKRVLKHFFFALPCLLLFFFFDSMWGQFSLLPNIVSVISISFREIIEMFMVSLPDTICFRSLSLTFFVLFLCYVRFWTDSTVCSIDLYGNSKIVRTCILYMVVIAFYFCAASLFFGKSNFGLKNSRVQFSQN